MKKNLKKVLCLVIGLMIGASTIVGATTIFRSEDITYNSPTNKTNVKDSLDELYNLTSNYEFYKPLASLVELGDYISMTPTSTNYVIPSSLTGADNNQTINPSNLNLWRVIKKNEDGTVEVVSEHVSDEEVTFKGRTGYINYIGVLNQIAAQYTNPKFVERTRHIGYNGQTEYIADSSKIGMVSAPWEKNTSLTEMGPCDSTTYLCGTYEYLGAGDIGYEEDLNLIINTFGSLSMEEEPGVYQAYFVASRVYAYISQSRWGYSMRYVDGRMEPDAYSTYYYNNKEVVNTRSMSVRPILTLKASNIVKTGDGKSESTAYIFE